MQLICPFHICHVIYLFIRLKHQPSCWLSPCNTQKLKKLKKSPWGNRVSGKWEEKKNPMFDTTMNNILNSLYQQTTGLPQITRCKTSDICQQTKGQKKQFQRTQNPYLFSFQWTFYFEICLYLCMSNTQENSPRPHHRSPDCRRPFSSGF